MSEPKQPAQSAGSQAPGAAAPPSSPSAGDPASEAKARVDALQAVVRALEAEVRILQGRFQNLSPEVQNELVAQGQALKKRIPLLERALLALLVDRHRSRGLPEQEIELASERKALIDFCKSKQVNPELWKNLEY